MDLPIAIPSLGQPLHARDRAEMQGVFESAIQQAERAQLRLRVPREDGLMQKLAGMHFHFKPELFLQVHGRTEFRFPRESFELRPGEMCIMPAGVPHAEAVFPEAGRPFRNLVAGYYSNTLSLHLAHEVAPRRPDIAAIEFFQVPNLQELEDLTNSLIQAQRRQAPARDHVVKGLTIALLGMFLNLVATAVDDLNRDIGKVFQVKWLIREQFSNPRLNVKTIAEKLQCSADYLSHLSHRETGEKLIHYIQRIRIEGARFALQTTPLYISEIAFASGFADPAYFARVFKRHTGLTPQEFRDQLDESHRAREARPKTIFFDRVDYTYGEPKPPLEPAAS
jgi:AraC-like DNA-binding protein